MQIRELAVLKICAAIAISSILVAGSAGDSSAVLETIRVQMQKLTMSLAIGNESGDKLFQTLKTKIEENFIKSPKDGKKPLAESILQSSFQLLLAKGGASALSPDILKQTAHGAIRGVQPQPGAQKPTEQKQLFFDIQGILVNYQAALNGLVKKIETLNLPLEKRQQLHEETIKSLSQQAFSLYNFVRNS